MARDEAELLPRWVDHYAREVGVDNLIVFDDGSTDGSTRTLPCTVHRLPELASRKYESTRMTLVSGMAQGLLARYDFVAFVDTDEFLVADPAHHAGLRDFLKARADREVIAPIALNVVHHTGVEPDIDPSRPVLDQRCFAKFTPLMCKPALKRIPAAWRYASHGITARFEVDPELFMIHLKFYDREHLRRRSNHRRLLVEADGRAAKSSWSSDGDEMVAVLDRTVRSVDPDGVPEFDPREVDLASVVHEEKGGWFRTLPQGQVRAMTTQPLVRIPQRLRGIV